MPGRKHTLEVSKCTLEAYHDSTSMCREHIIFRQHNVGKQFVNVTPFYSIDTACITRWHVLSTNTPHCTVPSHSHRANRFSTCS